MKIKKNDNLDVSENKTRDDHLTVLQKVVRSVGAAPNNILANSLAAHCYAPIPANKPGHFLFEFFWKLPNMQKYLLLH